MEFVDKLVNLESSNPIQSIQLVSTEEQALYKKLNETEAPYPMNKTISEVFYEKAEAFLNRIALSSPSGQLTYGELNERSNEIAHMLVSNGIKRGDFVAILMERSMETVISILGVLKAGGVYVPVDPAYPKDRCFYLLSDTGAPFILTKSKFAHLLDELLKDDSNVRTVFQVDALKRKYSKENIVIEQSSSDLAYIIYTSGSTGKPKGTMLKHESVINLIMANQRMYQTTEKDVFTQFISYSFDPSVTETFTAFFSGARLHMLTETERISIEEFADVVERERATVATVPNAFFNQLALHLPKERQAKLQTLRSISVGGEALMSSMIQSWQEKFGTNIEIFNVYGPTECTVLSTYCKVSEVKLDQSTIPIGRPISNYQAYILNEDKQLCPVNVPGELYIGGIGLAAGYLNQPTKTAESFVPNIFSNQANSRLYRTGDIVRLLPSGLIEFVGRKDSQVKVRGFRIEMGEIEAALSKIPQIEEAVVIAKKQVDGNNVLFAFYTAVSGINVSASAIRDVLKTQLPSYMVPEHFVQLDQMPLSPTGKIDRKQLALMEIQMMDDREYHGPENETQALLADAWTKVLGLERVGIHDDFFHIGGHSLKILQILVQVKKRFPFLKIQDFFEYPTIAEMENYIKSYQSESHIVDKKETWEVKDLFEPPALNVSHKIKSLPMKTVLLTGATGYLGSHVLYELLKGTDAHVYCLIRNNSSLSIEQKLIDRLQFYFGDDVVKELNKRVTAVQGDLSENELGLSQQDKNRLINEVDAIIHCGADVRHFGDASHFNQVNIEGTNDLLEIAKQRDGIHFHHISTIGIPEELALTQWDIYTKTGDFDYNVKLENVYNQSKLQAENVVRKAAINHHIPVTIYRVGNLSCHSKTGAFQRNIDDNAFYRMMKSMLYLGKAPKANWFVDFTPIDYASKAIVSLASQEGTNGQTFHLCNPKQLSYTSFIKYMKELGYQIDLMESEDYEDWLLNGDHSEESQEILSLAIAQLEGEGASDSELRFKCENVQSFLQSTNIHCAEPDQQFIQLMIEYGVKTNYFPKPKSVVVG